MQQPANNSSRKKFLWWGAAALAAVGSWKLFKRPAKKEPETITMLTQDGQLVEIEKKLLTTGRKATNQDLQQWLKNKQSPLK